MFNAKDLLGTLMDGGLSGSSRGRVDHALGAQGLGGQSGGLDSLMRGLGGSSGGTGGLLSGLAQSAGSLFGNAQQSVSSGNPLAVGGLGALAGALLGGGGGSVKGALGGTAMALLGSMAMQALQGSQSRDESAADVTAPTAAPLNVSHGGTAAQEQQLEAHAMLILRAMINAARADGHVDERELQTILGKLRESGADADAESFVKEAFQQPMETESILRDAKQDPVLATEVYAASLLAIEVDTFEERTYLAGLAQGLGLNQGTVSRIHEILGVTV